MKRWLVYLLCAGAVAFLWGCGGDQKKTETAQGGRNEDTSDPRYHHPPANPAFKVQGAILDSLRVKKQRFNITRDEYWEGEGGVLANQYFEVWYPAGRSTVTHGMYVFEELMPARKKLEQLFGEAPRELLVIRCAAELDVYEQLTGREWWCYSAIKGDSLTFSPIYILVKRGIAPVAIPREYYQWAVEKITQNGAPRWLEEGVASYLSNEGDILLNQMYEFAATDVSMTPEQIEAALQGEEDRRGSRIAYYRSYRMVRKLIDTYGEAKLKEAVVLIGRGNTLDQAFVKAYNKDYNTILREASDYTVELTKKKKK